MICRYCEQEHSNEGDQYGCPFCNGDLPGWMGEIIMTPSEECRAMGFSLSHVNRVTGVSVQTLINWHRNKHQLFAVVLEGVGALNDRVD